MANFIIKNDELISENKANISIKERGFLFGDGIFESAKIFNSKIYNFKQHLSRIKKGLEALKFKNEIFEIIENLEEKSLKLIAKNNIKEGILRISISRGIGSNGYKPTYESKPLIIIETLQNRDLPKFLNLAISKNKKPQSNSFPINHKTANSLIYVLNKLEAEESGFFDLVMLNNNDYISEISSANIFWAKDKKIFTPSKKCDILPGIIRQKLLEISPLEILEVEENISSLKNADEIFITNSSFLLVNIDEFLNKKLQKNIGLKLLEIIKKDLENCCK
jgi:branched-subunit amino acid aminotransferase/4-amino-4-deoxychorismate lyase